MAGESDQNVFFIQKDASSFAEFEISEFEISRVDCIYIIWTKNLIPNSFHKSPYCLQKSAALVPEVHIVQVLKPGLQEQ